MNRTANRLANETSPYLLQHAHNPVDWYPWGPEALARAKEENKPILVSIGYAACHWCHVMERESFENEETAAFMNANFINIKIDREERPDLDHIYMDAVQAMSGSGGWPLNVFLTTDGRPFYGGTYFPPRQAFNRPSWMDVLAGVSRTYHENPEEIASQAANLTSHLKQANAFGQTRSGDGAFRFETRVLEDIFQNALKSADTTEGGFGRAPKFPQTFTIHYLLLHAHFTRNKQALDQACLSLDKMFHGGIYDQVGGGFARYATDAAWLVPHFEKMLYDNGLLIMVYADALQITGKPAYKAALEETVEFLKRDLLSPEGLFFAALDADSEGEEGKFYVWDKAEIDEVLGQDGELFSKFYDISSEGNWEGKNILNIKTPLSEFIRQNNLDEQEFDALRVRSRRRLLERRSRRVKPQLDDKVILGWNALMITGLCKASAATGDKSMLALARTATDLILEKFYDQQTKGFFHTYKNQVARFPAFLDDYAFFIQALITLQELTGESGYLLKAKDITLYVIENFIDEERVFFYYTHKDQKDVIIRKKEIYDGAVPSGNSVMAWNLLYLSVVFDVGEWKETVVKMLNSLADTTVKFPTSFGNWAALIHKLTYGVNELVITGDRPGVIHEQILPIFMPHKVLQVASEEDEHFPLLRQKSFAGSAVIYLCKNYSCYPPVNEVHSLIRLIENDQPFS